MTTEQTPKEPSSPGLASLTLALDAAWKFGLFCPIALYTVGLIISNLHAEQFGRYNLGLDKAAYIIVGLLWGLLSLLGYAIFRQLRIYWDLPNIDSKGRTLGRLSKCLGMFVMIVILALLFSIVAGFVLLDGEELFTKSRFFLLIVVLGTGAAVDFCIRYVGPLLKERPFSFLSLGEFHNIYLIVRYVLPVLLAVIIYAEVAFPMLPPAFGGGAMLGVEVFVKPEGEKVLKQAGLSVGENSSLGVWLIVSDLPDAVVLRNRKPFSQAPFKTVWVRKENIAVYVYETSSRESLKQKP